MALFTDMVIITLLSPISNYVNKKKCAILEKYSGEEDRKAYAFHWVSQTELYGGFVKKYLGFDQANEGEDDF
jgi:hypothetical protein